MIKMLKALFACAVLYCPITAAAQNCNLDKDETDAFTNEHVRSGSNNVGASNMHWNFTLSQKGSKYEWELKVVYNKQLQDPMKKGDAILCKLENGKIVKLIADNDYTPSYKVFGDGVIITNITPKGTLDAADVKSFSESALSEMRATLSGRDIEPKISSKQGSAIQEIAACLLK